MKKLSLALPNGSLEKQILSMLAVAGINISKLPRQFRAEVDHPLIGEVVFMRPQHMPRMVAEGKYDLAICGLDFYREWYYSPHACHYQRTTLCQVAGQFLGPKADVRPTVIALVMPEQQAEGGVAALPKQSKILSEYPNLTKVWLRERGMCVEVEESLGSTEAHIPRDYPAGVCLVESGATLEANALKPVDVLLSTNPVLLSAVPTFLEVLWKRQDLERVIGQLQQAGLLRV